MNLNPESSAQMDFDTARREAEVIQGLRPSSEYNIKQTLSNHPEESARSLAKIFGDSAFIELASQEIDNLRENHPHLYDGLMQRQEHLNDLTEVLYPSYVPLGVNHHMSSTERAISVGDVSDKVKGEAYNDARALAVSLMTQISNELRNNPPRDPKAEYTTALNLALKMSEKSGYGIETENIKSVLSLAAAGLANYRLSRMMPRGTPPFSVDINRAIDKHNAYQMGIRSIAG